MSGVVIKKKEGEATSSLVYRFTKKVRQSGILREAKSRRFTQRKQNKTALHRSAMHRFRKAVEYEKMKKQGLL